MKYFKEQYTYEIIKDVELIENLDKKIIDEWCVANDIVLYDVDDISRDWAKLSYYFGYKRGLTRLEYLSFGYMITTFLAPICISYDTDKYFRESDIEFDCFVIFESLKKEEENEKDLARKLFYHIYSLYKSDIEKYSYKTYALNFRLSDRDYHNFMNIKGETKIDKLRVLLNNYYKR